MKSKLAFLSLGILATAVATAQRAPTVSYTVTGSAGAWDLNFTVTSNFLGGEGQFYFFGVLLDSGGNVQSSPGNWDPTVWPTWDNSAYGGSSTVYNNNWINQPLDNTIGEGSSKSGFVARSTDAVAPTSVKFFAFAFNGTYGGNDFFNGPTNPGFEGVANASSVPEPASMAALGLGALALVRRRRASK